MTEEYTSVLATAPTTTSVLKPLWALQFFLTMLIYHMTTYIILAPIVYVQPTYCLMLIVTAIIFVWITGIAIMNQSDLDNVSFTMTTGLHLIGIPIFIVLGLTFFSAPSTVKNYILVKLILLLSFLLAGAFLLEILMVLPLARKNKLLEARKFSIRRKVDVYGDDEPDDDENGDDDILPPDEPAKRDLTTSVSSLRLPPDADETATPDHSYRRVSFARRREYIDAPTSAPSIAAVKIAEIQTEPQRVSVEASQTCKCELKEVLVQTVSRCEFCDQKMQAGAAAVPTPLPAAVCGPPCPTVVQLLRSGMTLPYCANCSCAAEILQQKQPSQQLQYPKQDEPQQKQLQYPRQDQPQQKQLQYPRQDQPQQKQLQYPKREQPQQPQQLQCQDQEEYQPQQKIVPKTSQVQPEEQQRIQRTFSKESDRGDGSQALTSFTKVTITAFCAAPNATTMEVSTSNGSKENVITTFIPQTTAPTEVTGKPQITTTSQQTEKSASFVYSKVHRVVGAQGRENEYSKEEAIFASECYDMGKTAVDDEDSYKKPQQAVHAVTSKSDDDDSKTDVQRSDTKDYRQLQTAKTPKETNTTTAKTRRVRDQSNPIRHVKRTKRSSAQNNQKEKKDDARTYSRFLPLEDVKPRDPRCIEPEYDMSNICIPIHTDEVVDFSSCSGSRPMPPVFQRCNRIDPAYLPPECEGFAIQTDNPHFQCQTDTPAETATIHPDTTATDSDICPACRKGQMQFPQADVFQYYNVYKDKEGRIYCDICAPPYSNKVPIIMNRSGDIPQECFICGNFLYTIDAHSVGVTHICHEGSSYCMKCGQLQSKMVE